MISTYHSHDTRTVTVRGKEVVKPLSVLDHDKSMGGVDLKDQLLHSYLIERKRMNKWYMKLFRRLLNASILNSMIVYRSNTGKRIQQLTFIIQLIEGLFVKYVSAVEHKVLGSHPSDNTVARLTERHFISKIPPTVKKSRPHRKCVVCQKRGRRRDTVYWCDACSMGLCIECFRDYHTQQNFKVI
ncbi:piggyBac transposable element-derived protein 4-like [Cryptotermes secundus]|uniref:piggyBac transposable element-derived protein 4-like n=1 Tax=Cryptotermes secundus TaxID=105785 RepID=UPI000CD7D357|nr:piggyBac transposable element-derived protein 4-like [Cryptotermes secundus]